MNRPILLSIDIMSHTIRVTGVIIEGREVWY